MGTNHEQTSGHVLACLKTPADDLPEPPRLTSFARTLRRRYWSAKVRILDIIFERGVETAGRALALDHFNSDFVHYSPSAWLWLPRALRRIKVRPSDVFVDFGSGKGRIVLQAARYPFARVLGVEISERINSIARLNIERNRRRFRCRNVELVTADAAAFDIPDDMTIAYFYYPFAGETFRRVINRIVESIDRNPRRVTLIYACPKCESTVLETGRFRLDRMRGPKDSLLDRVSIYVSDPVAVAAHVP